MSGMEQELSARLRRSAAALVGFADLSAVDDAVRQGFPRAVSFCLALAPAVVAGIADGPTEDYVAEYHRLNGRLAEMGRDLAETIQAKGWRAQARPATGDWSQGTLRAPFQHKTAATLAGLGWIGKCALLITPHYGPAVRWATVLTDAPLPTGVPVTRSHCGNCTACVDVCPGKACTGKEWRQGMPREDFWDPRACLEGMRRVSMAKLHRAGICGMCIAACPYTQAYLQRASAGG